MNTLEMQQPEDLKKDNWRNWKYIRNNIVDHFKLPKHKNKGIFVTNLTKESNSSGEE